MNDHPHRELSPEARQGLLEECATRDGTDHGERETALKTRVAQVWRQRDQGTAGIVFHQQDGRCTILPKDQALQSTL